jgi:hypothetical protein
MGRRPIGDKAMTAAERQSRMRQRREDEANSLRSEIQVLKDALSPASKRRTKIDLPPGEAADLTKAVLDEVSNLDDQFRNVFEPKYRAWRALKSAPPKKARTRVEVYLKLMSDSFLECCPSVQDRLAAKDAVIADLEEQRDARITELKTSRADEDHEWLAECIQHWSEGTRLFVAKELMEGLGHGPINKWATELWLIVNMINSLPDYERRITLIAGIVAFVKGDKALADFVQALRPADRKRLAAALANRSARR